VKSNREEAFRFLNNCGKVSNQEKDTTVLPTSKKAIQILPESVVAAAISWTASPVKKKADYATLFRLNHNKKIAIGYLVTVAEHSKKHTLHQYNARYLLHTYARQGFLFLINSPFTITYCIIYELYIYVVVNHFIKRDETFITLVDRSERARTQCTLQDESWVALIRIGSKWNGIGRGIPILSYSHTPPILIHYCLRTYIT